MNYKFNKEMEKADWTTKEVMKKAKSKGKSKPTVSSVVKNIK